MCRVLFSCTRKKYFYLLSEREWARLNTVVWAGFFPTCSCWSPSQLRRRLPPCHHRRRMRLPPQSETRDLQPCCRRLWSYPDCRSLSRWVTDSEWAAVWRKNQSSFVSASRTCRIRFMAVSVALKWRVHYVSCFRKVLKPSDKKKSRWEAQLVVNFALPPVYLHRSLSAPSCPECRLCPPAPCTGRRRDTWWASFLWWCSPGRWGGYRRCGGPLWTWPCLKSDMLYCFPVRLGDHPTRH